MSQIREVSGTVGKIITRDDAHLFCQRSEPPELEKGEVILTVNESPIPAKLDSILNRLTFGCLGYSIEPADTQTVVVPAGEVPTISEGDKVTVRIGPDGARVVETSDTVREADGGSHD